MQFVFFYYLIKRIFRAIKVVGILLTRRDLVKQLPGGYLRDLATSNRWFQMQLLGICCFVLWTLSVVFLDSETLSGVRGILFLVGLASMTMNIARLLIHRR